MIKEDVPPNSSFALKETKVLLLDRKGQADEADGFLPCTGKMQGVWQRLRYELWTRRQGWAAQGQMPHFP
eukprot:scaffold271620_cov14-Tisochrysis_lutea.AAC.1